MPPRSRRKARKHPASPLDQLTSQQFAFVRVFVSLGGARGSQLAAYDGAYEDHGGSPSARRSSAAQLLHNPRIKAAIEHLLLTQEKIKALDRNIVMAHLLRNDAAAYQAGDIAASNRALELLGKALGNVFTDHGNDAALDLVRMVRGLAQGSADIVGEVTVAEYRELSDLC